MQRLDVETQVGSTGSVKVETYSSGVPGDEAAPQNATEVMQRLIERRKKWYHRALRWIRLRLPGAETRTNAKLAMVMVGALIKRVEEHANLIKGLRADHAALTQEIKLLRRQLADANGSTMKVEHYIGLTRIHGLHGSYDLKRLPQAMRRRPRR